MSVSENTSDFLSLPAKRVHAEWIYLLCHILDPVVLLPVTCAHSLLIKCLIHHDNRLESKAAHSFSSRSSEKPH